MNVSLMPIIFSKVPKNVTRPVFRQTLVLKKQAPHIFFVGGLAGMVTSTVLACRATLHLSETLDEIQVDIDAAKEIKNDHPQLAVDHQKDIAYIYGKSALKLGRLYGPALAVGVVSVSALSGAHIHLARRNTALMAAYTTLQAAYDKYREQVAEAIGAEKELEIYRPELKCLEDAETEGRTGFDPTEWSPYARFFDESSTKWEKNAEFNKQYLWTQQNWANEMLYSRGHLFLNEVYDMLGLERDPAGAVVGWTIDGTGDNYVDFGLDKKYNLPFDQGLERSVLLDFNVDGVIYNKI